MTLTQAKSHLRVDGTYDDDYISTLITVAREYCEDYTHTSLGSCNYELVLDGFPPRDNKIVMPVSPATVINYVKFKDAGGNESTMDPSEYIGDIDRLPAAVFLPYFGIWPVIIPYPGAAVRVGFTAGYTIDNVPKRFFAAMNLLIGHWYNIREDVSIERKIEKIPDGVDSLLWPLRVF